MKLNVILGLLLISLSAGGARASEEDYLEWQAIKIDCFENSQTGKVKISARIAGRGIAAFTVTAFGREYEVPRDGLARIKDYPLNSLRTSHEAGYPQLGGHVVYARMRRSVRDKDGKPRTEEALVSVNKEKGLSVETRAAD